MMYENDKLQIPEEYKQMSVHELREKKECIYLEMQREKTKEKQEQLCKKEEIQFHF